MNIIESLNRGLEQKYHLNEAKEDKERFKAFVNDDDLYNRFELLKSKQIIKGQDADYTYWEKQSINALKDFIEKTEAKQEEKNKERTAVAQHYRQISDLIEGEDYNFIYGGNGWTIYEILTHKASMWLGRDTKWCITMKNDPSFFNQYKNKGANYYFLIPDKNPESGKWCYLYYNKELKLSDKYFWDSRDKSHTIEDIDIPSEILSYLPGTQKLIDYIKERQEMTAEVQRTGVYTYNPLDNKDFIQRLKPKKIVIPNSVEKIGKYVFAYCNFLQEITISNSVKKIGYGAFRYCWFLQEINLPNSVKEIGGLAFEGCTSLKEINIPDSVEKIGNRAFQDCTSLQEITIPNNVKEIGECTFSYCGSLKEINLPNSVKEIGGLAFNRCTSLKEINIPDSVEKIGDHAFYYCTSLQEINISNRVEKIESKAFAYCISLKEITLPNSIEEIGNCAFYNCSSLKEINLPNSIKEIWGSAFYKCSSLKEIVIKGEYRPQIFKDAGLTDNVILNWVDAGIKETVADIK